MTQPTIAELKQRCDEEVEKAMALSQLSPDGWHRLQALRRKFVHGRITEKQLLHRERKLIDKETP